MQAYVCMCLAKVNGEAAKEGTSNGYSMITQKPWLEDLTLLCYTKDSSIEKTRVLLFLEIKPN